MTITVEEEVARWARIKAAEENTSVAKLVGRLLEREMRQSDEYRRAWERWSQAPALAGIAAEPRPGRDELHERG